MTDNVWWVSPHGVEVGEEGASPDEHEYDEVDRFYIDHEVIGG